MTIALLNNSYNFILKPSNPERLSHSRVYSCMVILTKYTTARFVPGVKTTQYSIEEHVIQHFASFSRYRSFTVSAEISHYTLYLCTHCFRCIVIKINNERAYETTKYPNDQYLLFHLLLKYSFKPPSTHTSIIKWCTFQSDVQSQSD